ncbi:hypothetical protein SAMN04490186_5879 [Pseudomonas grimontii]|uniref:Uncharacterized protein n=1 Tax=Pseudomonas grimontii TaxID=129847 RepID=A0A1H1ILM6_9PSED|nr:hypothetical protein [Pseudomonas grimontii]TWR64429.1 hypothetical protein FIV39_19795 [Pseudomonas grimontii]SDR38564.1 hypothetical protein SAMN04490186_5879 [Pseudomonas grimontii]
MPNKSYTVLSGSFRGSDDKLTGPGGVIELPDDVAERFRHQLEVLVVEPAPAPSAAGEGGRKPAKVSPDA